MQVFLWLCRFHRLPFVAKISRQQLFQYLQDCASVMIAFHYAHTDAAQSMLHFDLIIQQDQHMANVAHGSGANQLDNAQSSTSDIQPNGNAAQSANHDAQANGILAPSGGTQADGTQAGASSNGKDQGVSFKGDTCGKAVNA